MGNAVVPLSDEHPLCARIFLGALYLYQGNNVNAYSLRETGGKGETGEMGGSRLVSLVYLVCLVCLVELDQPDEQNKPDTPDQPVPPVPLAMTDRLC